MLNDVSSNPYLKLTQGSYTWYLQGYNNYLYLGGTSTAAFRIDSSGNAYSPAKIEAKSGFYHSTVNSNSYVLLAGGGYKALSEFGSSTGTVDLSNYVTLDGTQTISGVKTFSKQQKFTVATGTSPFTVSSTTMVSNLNSEFLGGKRLAELFTALSYSGSTLSVTVGGITKTCTISSSGGTVDLSGYVTLATAQTISGKKTFSVQQAFTVATGTSPFTVSSTTMVTNLNAQMWNGYKVSVTTSPGTDANTFYVIT